MTTKLPIAPKSLILAVIGTGAMGRGIAQIAAQAGIKTKLYDAKPGAAEAAAQGIKAQWARLVEKNKMTSEAATAAGAALQIIDGLSGCGDCHMVVEAIVENLDAKRQLFKQLEDIVSVDCILATNTSSLSVTEIQATLRVPQRCLGWHFFNPVPLMKVAEIIPGLLTENSLVPWLSQLTRDLGHKAVIAQDTPGFIVNHAGRGYGTEALRILGEGIAPVEAIDGILREAGQFRMGPFELLDLTGLDVSQPVMESIYDQFFQEPRFRPSPIAKLRLKAGLLGRKTGRGFYDYRDGQAGVTTLTKGGRAPLKDAPLVWVSQKSGSTSDDSLTQEARSRAVELLERLEIKLDRGAVPEPTSLILVTPLGWDATTCAVREGLDASRTIALDTFADLSRRRTLMSTPVTSKAMQDIALALFDRDDCGATLIHDSAGFVVPRVIAAIVNIGCEMAQQQLATPEDIETAVTLGLGYPKGPLSLGDAYGTRRVLAVLERLYEFYGDPRYRPSPWLKRRAQLGLSLLHRDV